MWSWPRREALHCAYTLLREFESTADERDLEDFNAVMGCAAACVHGDGTLRIDPLEALDLADAYLEKAKLVSVYGQGRCMMFQTLGALLGYAASVRPPASDEAAFIASVLGSRNGCASPGCSGCRPAHRTM